MTVRVTDEVREALERLAATNERSLSWHIQKALEAYLDGPVVPTSAWHDDRNPAAPYIGGRKRRNADEDAR